MINPTRFTQEQTKKALFFNVLLLVFVFLTQLLSQVAKAQSLTPCEAVYSQRPNLEKVKESIECFVGEAAQANSGSDQRIQSLAHAALASVWISNKFPKTELEPQFIQRGFLIVQQMQNEFPNAAETFYWRAVFTSSDVRMKDRGAPVPRNTLSALGKIQGDLKAAIKVNPAVHEFGPNRVLGVMHSEMPAIAGGDKQYAEQNLKIALEGAPRTAMNYRYYANILRINKKNQQARELIESFLNMKPEELNPFDRPELLPVQEIQDEKNEAKKILEKL